MPRRHKPRAKSRKDPVSLRLEELESRLAPADLAITNALLVDGNNVPITPGTFPVGQKVFVRAEWTTSDLTPADQYIVRYVVDGVTLDSATINGQAGTNVNVSHFLGGWYASPGAHNVQVTVDGANTIAENNEGDNVRTFPFTPVAPADLPMKFFWPVGGGPTDAAVVNYVDVNPLPTANGDFRGGPFTYDGHDAFDVTLPNFHRMDSGIPVYAAADGTVASVVDGNFDRETAANPRPANSVVIDHGNGWQTRYLHFARNSIVVKAAQAVKAGDLLGLVGSSGSSTDAHLHFAVYHNGANVETMYAPGDYFRTAPTYQGDQPTAVLDHGITNYDPTNDIKERPSEIDRFSPTATSGNVVFWQRISHLNPGDVVRVEWYRPNGALEALNTSTANSIVRYGLLFWELPFTSWAGVTGTWDVVMRVNGNEVARDTFLVAASSASIRLVEGTSTYVLDGRTTPIDFGSVAASGTAPTRTFTVNNHGSALLSLSAPTLPTGFSVMGTFPNTVAAGNSATFTLQLDTAVVGNKFGAVQFNTNDADALVFNFNVEGVVTGTATANAPVITLPDPPAKYLFGEPGRVLDAAATVTDPNSTHFNMGRLTVEFASGGTVEDRLGIRNEGTSAGQIGVNTSTGVVTFGGTQIGTFTGGSGTTTPLVVTFTSTAATPAAVQALLRNITYFNISANPGSAPRYVRFSINDDTNVLSNLAIKKVILAPSATRPAVAVNQASTQSDPTNTSPINFTVVFSEAVTGFNDQDDVVVGGTAFGMPMATPTVTVTPVSATTYTVAISGMTQDGTVTLTVPAGRATDIDGETNTASTSTDNSVTFDTTPPTVTINQEASQADPTNSPTINFTVVFNEPVTGFTHNEVTLTGTADLSMATSTVTGSGTTFNVAVSGMQGQGTVIAVVPAGVATDLAGNANLASTSTDNEVTYDPIRPEVTINQAATQTDPTTSGTINFTAVFSEAVVGFTGTDVTLSGTAGATTAVVTLVSGNTYNVAVSGMTQDGTVIVNIGPGEVTDPAGNPNNASTSGDNTVTYVGTPPNVTVNQATTQVDPTNTSPIIFTVVFNEEVTGFTDGDVTITSTAGPATATVSGSGTTYTVTVSGMTQDGTVTVTIPAGVAVDVFGNGNTASTSTDNVVRYDPTRPTVTVDQASTQVDPTNTSPINFTVVFSEAVTGFTNADVILGGTAGATTAVVTGSGTTYNVAVSGMTSDGTVIVNVGEGVAVDAAGNTNVASTSTDNVVTYDTTSPSVTINQSTTQADPTNASTIFFTVVFSEAVTGFTSSDVTISGSAGATTALVSGSGTTYTVAVSGMVNDGTVIVNIPAGVAVDAAGNANTDSTSTDNTVLYDTTPPTVTVNQAATQADPTGATTIHFTVVFSEAVTGFTDADVTLSGTAGATTAVVTGSGTTYNVAVSGMTSDGTIIVNVAGGVAVEAAGNANTASTSIDNVVVFDTRPPGVTIDQAASQADPTNARTINFTVVFSEVVTGFTSNDIILGGSAGATTAVVTGSGTTYNVAVSGMTSDGTVIATIGAGAALDAAGNASTASASTDNSVTFKGSRPSVVVDQAAGQTDPTSRGPINFTVVFSEAVTGFTNADVILGGTAGATAVLVTGSGTTYNVAVSGMASDGTVIVTVGEGVAVDAFGNTNTASTSTDNDVVFDTTRPTVTINRAGTQADATGDPTINFTVVFSEAVTGFTSNDIILGGSAGATTVVVTGSGTTYNVAVSGMIRDGTVTVAVGADAAGDAAGNSNVASTSTDNDVVFDTTRPGVTVNQAANQTDPTGSTVINFTVVFSQAVTGFTSDDVTLGGTAGATTAVVTGSGTTYNVAVSGMTQNGTVTVTIPEGAATDAAGNTTLASTSTDNVVTFDDRLPLALGPVIGTDQDDVILIRLAADNLLEVVLNGVVVNRFDPGAQGPLVIEGRGGHDHIEVGENVSLPVLVLGGAGNDTILGGAGNDTLLGGEGSDLMFGRAGDDQIFGEDGNDAMDGNDGNDSMGGGAGDDLMFGSAGNDVMFGEAGNDAMDGGADNDGVDGADGNDLVFGSGGDDLLFAGAGNDSMDGGAGNDSMDGGAGDDLMFGLDGNDFMFGLAGNDSIDGGAGNDTVDAGAGNDLIFGSLGNDLIFAGLGNDSIDGNDGNDIIDAGEGNDLIFGSGGDDQIFGGLGSDSIDGGSGANSVDGVPGINVIFN